MGRDVVELQSDIVVEDRRVGLLWSRAAEVRIALRLRDFTRACWRLRRAPLTATKTPLTSCWSPLTASSFGDVPSQTPHVVPGSLQSRQRFFTVSSTKSAAAALEPSFKLKSPRHPRGLKPALYVDKAKNSTPHETCDRLMSQFTSQWDDLKKEIRENAKGLAPRALGAARAKRRQER